MNAQTQIFAAEPCTQKRSDIDEVHLIRSKIIDKCAHVERWLFEHISLFARPEMMLTKKIVQFSGIIELNDSGFRKPEIVKERLQNFAPYARFRSEITHSEIKEVQIDAKPHFVFLNAGRCDDPATKSVIITLDELEGVRKTVSRAANDLTTLRPTPPSSPPQQMPAAATGP